MSEFVVQLYLGLAQLFADLFPERFREWARAGPLWRRIVAALFVAFGSLVVGLVVAALALALAFLLFGIVVAIVRLF